MRKGRRRDSGDGGDAGDTGLPWKASEEEEGEADHVVPPGAAQSTSPSAEAARVSRHRAAPSRHSGAAAECAGSAQSRVGREAGSLCNLYLCPWLLGRSDGPREHIPSPSSSAFPHRSLSYPATGTPALFGLAEAGFYHTRKLAVLNKIS